MLAWAFDVGPHGLEKTTPATLGEECPPALLPRRRNLYALAAIGLVIAIAAGFYFLPRASSGKIEKSIALLPFDNFSEDKETNISRTASETIC